MFLEKRQNLLTIGIFLLKSIYHTENTFVYNTKTNELISVEQYMNVAIQGAGKIAGIKQITIDRQELINTVRITDFKY